MARVLGVGAGHVGLPLALKLWQVGHDVALVDVDRYKIHALLEGAMPFVEEGCGELLTDAARSPRFRPVTYDQADFDRLIEQAEFVVLTLGTPLGTDYTFRFDQYFDVLNRMVPHLSRGVTLVVRSTVAPHFTRNVVTSRIATERRWVPGVDFFASFCPERLVQGRALKDIDELPEIIGADDPETARRASELFRTLGASKPLFRVSSVEAELAKLYLNTLRYTLFGLANEFALISEQYGADVFQILEAANTDYPRGGIPKPGPSRGPCLGKDTATLAFSTTAGLIAHAAIKTNEGLVLHVAQGLREALGSLAGRRIAVLGLAFKADTDDIRDNLTSPLVNLLDREGAMSSIYDPFVHGYDDPSVLQSSHAIVLMTPHSRFAEVGEVELCRLANRPRRDLFVYDLWNLWPWADRILGKGSDELYEDSGYRRLRLAHAGGHSPTD